MSFVDLDVLTELEAAVVGVETGKAGNDLAQADVASNRRLRR